MSVVEPAAAQTNGQGFDVPVSDPSGDLLDMDQHAQALAKYIRLQESQLPFTIGIFGEWGEGKTTLVRFLCHHLTRLERSSSQKPVRFISFSAWPHTTSEKLWRALILEIAQVLLKESYEEQKQLQVDTESGIPTATGWLPAMTSFLNGDAFVLKAIPPPANEYLALLEKLDSTDYGKVSKRSGSPQLDEEATMMAVAKGAMTVLGTVSPLVAGLRSLLGIESAIDVGKLVQENNESSRQTIESLPRFQEIFGEMLNDKAKDGPIYVFIDDLDRAQPDVALDIMESIRIALAKVRCVFIIAVDERLIAQGLRLRYKELFAQENATSFATKGQEYLEKIIQFRMRVPPRTAEQVQRFIAAQFPQWMPAGDIIQTIAGNNPRRLKQYCERLTFQYMIGSSPFTLGFRPGEDATTGPPPASGARIEPATPQTENRTSVAESMANPPPSGPSAVVSLSRILGHYSETDLRYLFLELGLNYGDFPGEPIDRVNKLLAEFKRDERLDRVAEAMARLTPSVLENVPDKRPASPDPENPERH